MPDVEIHKTKLDEASGAEVQQEYQANVSPEEEEESSPEEVQQVGLFKSLKNSIGVMQETFRHRFNTLFSKHNESGREAVLKEFQNTDKYNATKILSNIERAVQNVLGRQGPSTVVKKSSMTTASPQVVDGQIEVKNFDQFESTLEGMFSTMLRADGDIQNILKDDINRARRRARARGAGTSKEVAKLEDKLKKICEGNRYILELRDRIRKYFRERAEKQSTKETSSGEEIAGASIATCQQQDTETEIEEAIGFSDSFLEKPTEVLPLAYGSDTLFDSTVPITGCQELINNMDKLATGMQFQALLLKTERWEKLKKRYRDNWEWVDSPGDQELVGSPGDQELVGSPGDRELVGSPGDRELVGSPRDEESVNEGQELDHYYYGQDLDDFPVDQKVADSILASSERSSPMEEVASERGEPDIPLKGLVAQDSSRDAFKQLLTAMRQLRRSEQVLSLCLERAIKYYS